MGRAPGTDLQTAQAICRTSNLYPNFEEDVMELQGYFKDSQAVHAYPAAGLDVPIYLLGSSTDSAYLAAKLGLPYAFAAHFAPVMLAESVSIYRREFQASAKLAAPYVILCANVVVAASTEEARRLATSQTMSFAGIATNRPTPLQPPKDSDEAVWQSLNIAQPSLERVKQVVNQMTAVSFVGDKAEVANQIRSMREQVPFDELMAHSSIFDQTAQVYSYQLLAEVVKNEILT